MNKYNPLHAGYHIELLREIKIKKAVINVHGQCVLRVISGCRSTLARNHTNRESSYQHYNTVLNLQGIQFPMRLNQIIKFENQNNISVNVSRNRKKFFLYSIDAPAERGTSMLICCTYRIITKSILRWLKICPASWDRKLLDPKIRNISAISKDNKKKNR